MAGWIKYHRSFRDHWLYKTKKPKTRREAWEDILLIVNYEPKKVLIRGQLYDCDKGQSLLSLDSWAKEFNWSIQMVRSFFSVLKKDEMITLEGMQYTTRLTVCNYVKYQCIITDEQQPEQHADNIPITDEQQAANKPPTTTKESKEVKKVKNIDELQQIFLEEVKKFRGEYTDELLDAFYIHWSEPNIQKTKMRKDLEKTWETSRRLSKWYSNSFKFKK